MRTGWGRVWGALAAAAIISGMPLSADEQAVPGGADYYESDAVYGESTAEWWQDWDEYEDQTAPWLSEDCGPTRYASAEFLLAWGKTPGDNLIGAPQFSNLYFFPDAPNSFPHQSTDEFGDMLHYGVRGRFGWDNPDDRQRTPTLASIRQG